MKITTAFWIASPFLATGLGVWAFYQHVNVHWASCGYSVLAFSCLATALANRYVEKYPWISRLEPVRSFCNSVGVVLVLATVAQAIAANPADWFAICLKYWGFTLLPAAIIALVVVAAILVPFTPAHMRSGRKVPLTPFLERK